MRQPTNEVIHNDSLVRTAVMAINTNTLVRVQLAQGSIIEGKILDRTDCILSVIDLQTHGVVEIPFCSVKAIEAIGRPNDTRAPNVLFFPSYRKITSIRNGTLSPLIGRTRRSLVTRVRRRDAFSFVSFVNGHKL